MKTINQILAEKLKDVETKLEGLDIMSNEYHIALQNVLMTMDALNIFAVMANQQGAQEAEAVEDK